MPRFAANLSMLYGEHAFADRFAAAARDGFAGVEFLFPYAHAPAELAARLRDTGLQMVLFNAPPGGHSGTDCEAAWAAGERGTAAVPGREAEFRAGVALALRYADALACPRLHVMAGVLSAHASEAERAAAWATYEANLRWAAAEAARQGVRVLIEPLNPRDMPGYLLQRQGEAHALVERIGAPNLHVQMDLYHCQIVEGDVSARLRRYLPTGRVGHLQIAGVPARHEPDEGELNYAHLFALIDELSAAHGWAGWVGCEYRPRLGAQHGGTTAGLRWIKALAGAGRS